MTEGGAAPPIAQDLALNQNVMTLALLYRPLIDRSCYSALLMTWLCFYQLYLPLSVYDLLLHVPVSILFRHLHKAGCPMRKDPLHRLRNTEGEGQEPC